MSDQPKVICEEYREVLKAEYPELRSGDPCPACGCNVGFHRAGRSNLIMLEQEIILEQEKQKIILEQEKQKTLIIQKEQEIILEQEKQKTLKIQKSLVTLKAGMVTKRISARNTETITTPVEPADRPPFVNMLVVGMAAMDFEQGVEEPNILTSPEDSVLMTNYPSPALFPDLKLDVHWSAKEKEDCKRYVELLRSVVGVRGMMIALFPAGCPTTVNILYGRHQSRQLCHYCPSATFNAYSYLTRVCGADAIVLVKNIEDRVIVNCKDYYAEKIPNKPDTCTPSML